MTEMREADENDIIHITNDLNRVLNGKQFGPVIVALMRMLADGLATAEGTKDERKRMLKDVIEDMREHFDAYMAEHEARMGAGVQ